MAALRSILNTTVALRLLEVHSHSLGALVLNAGALISCLFHLPGLLQHTQFVHAHAFSQWRVGFFFLC